MEISLACSYLWYNSVFKWCSLVTVKVITLCRPVDSRLEHVNFDSLLQCLTVDKLLQVFASVLLERRLILIADKLRYYWAGRAKLPNHSYMLHYWFKMADLGAPSGWCLLKGFLAGVSIIKLTDGKEWFQQKIMWPVYVQLPESYSSGTEQVNTFGKYTWPVYRYHFLITEISFNPISVNF